jgi:hypothetical protein
VRGLHDGNRAKFAKLHDGKVFKEKSLQCIVWSSTANSKFAKEEKNGREGIEKEKLLR